MGVRNSENTSCVLVNNLPACRTILQFCILGIHFPGSFAKWIPVGLANGRHWQKKKGHEKEKSHISFSYSVSSESQFPPDSFSVVLAFTKWPHLLGYCNPTFSHPCLDLKCQHLPVIPPPPATPADLGMLAVPYYPNLWVASLGCVWLLSSSISMQTIPLYELPGGISVFLI